MNNHTTPIEGCQEFQELTRRQFLRQTPSTLALTSGYPQWLPKVVLATDENSDRDTLIVIMLAGGMDGLTSLVPFGDPNLYNSALRPDIVIPPPGEPNGATDLDGFFGLPPAMSSLYPAYQSGQLLPIHATGSPDPTRSHFEAFIFMEYGIPLQSQHIHTGWLARHLMTTPPLTTSPLRAIALQSILPKTLQGAPGALPIPNPANYDFPGQSATASVRRDVISATYSLSSNPLPVAAQNTLDTIDLLASIDIGSYVPSGGASYPNSSFGNAMRSVAALVNAEVGLEAATLELGGWDTHNEQGVFNGGMFNLMTNLSDSIAAFHLDMQNKMDRLTVVMMSEFGRRADQNGSLGTDHGHGNCMFVMGGHIDGGRVLADWTDGELLHPDLQYNNDSLQVTTDYRDILAEIVEHRLGNTNLAEVFPSYTPTFQGITI